MLTSPPPSGAPRDAQLQSSTTNETAHTKLDRLFEAVEPYRRRTYVAGAVLATAGVASLFVSWDYPGAICAIAAGSIAADSMVTENKFRGRLEGRIGACVCSCKGEPTAGGCGQVKGDTCGAPYHIYGASVITDE